MKDSGFPADERFQCIYIIRTTLFQSTDLAFSLCHGGLKPRQPLLKPEHGRRAFTCLQVCHLHCRLYFCT